MSAVILLLVLFFISACGKREVRIDPGTKRKIDSTAAKVVNAMRPELDSLCLLRHDALMEAAIDSIVEQRELEMRKMVGE